MSAVEPASFSAEMVRSAMVTGDRSTGMTSVARQSRRMHEPAQFENARALAMSTIELQQRMAVRTVAGNAVDAQDLRNLLSMLGLEINEEPQTAPD